MIASRILALTPVGSTRPTFSHLLSTLGQLRFLTSQHSPEDGQGPQGIPVEESNMLDWGLGLDMIVIYYMLAHLYLYVYIFIYIYTYVYIYMCNYYYDCDHSDCHDLINADLQRSCRASGCFPCFLCPGLGVCRHMHLSHVTPGSFIGLDVDPVWMWMFVGVHTLICGLHMHLLHCVFLPCHGR